MPEATFRQLYGAVDYTPAGAVLAGAIIQLADGRAAVVQTDLAAGEQGSAAIDGRYEVTADTAVVFADGEVVYWDPVAKTAKNAADNIATSYALGSAIGAKTSGQLIVRVELNQLTGDGRTVADFASAVTLDKSLLGRGDATVFLDTQAGAFTTTLMPAATVRGKRLTFIRAGTGINAATIDGNAAELIDGAATHATMDAIRDTITIESDGANWFLVCSRIV